jgi:hypothetical protein
MSEKHAIERETAEGFLLFYNQIFGTDFKVVEMADAPDVRCADSLGNSLNLEVTITEDRPGTSRHFLVVPKVGVLKLSALTLNALPAVRKRLSSAASRTKWATHSSRGWKAN